MTRRFGRPLEAPRATLVHSQTAPRGWKLQLSLHTLALSATPTEGDATGGTTPCRTANDVGIGCLGSHGVSEPRRRSARREKPSADARDRQLVHDQDDGPATGVRSDGLHRDPGNLRDALHLPRWRTRASASVARPVVDGEPGREDAHDPASAGRSLCGRDSYDLGRRRLLAPPPAQPERQSCLSARRRHRLGERQVWSRAALEGPSARVADDPRRPLDEHPQREARAGARRDRRCERPRERSGGEVAQLGRPPRAQAAARIC